MENPARADGTGGVKWVDEAAIRKLREMGDAGFVVEMIDALLAYVPRVVSEARAGLIAGNFDPVIRMGHSLKSSAQTFGAEPLRILAVDVERRARGGEAGSLPPLLDEMERVFDGVRESLLRIRNEQMPASRSAE